MADLPVEIVPSFLGPEPAEWVAIKQEVDADHVELLEELEEDGYEEFEDDDLDVGFVEHMDTLALADGQNHHNF